MSRKSSDSTVTEKFPEIPDISLTAPSPMPDTTTTASAPAAVPSRIPSRHGSRHGSRVHYASNIDTTSPTQAPYNSMSPNTGFRRRMSRSNTFRTVEEFEDFESQPGWRPGAEPGIDPSKPDGGQETVPDLHAECQITVVDYSQDQLEVHELDNAELIEFVKQPQPSWVKCRWINVNGLSWDVIQALGQYKDLHRLAIEDIMNTRNRTKAEW